jgi:lactoylglutathione lyase
VLELVEYVAPKGRRTPDPQICNPGEGHLAMVVDDIQAAHRRLSAAGARFVSAPNAITEGVNRGGWTCYFRDPDEITLELVQPPPR